MRFLRKPTPAPERRGPYRSHPPRAQGLTALVVSTGGRAVGDVVDLSASDLCVSFARGAAPQLVEGDVVEVTVQSLSHGMVTMSARVARLRREGALQLRCALEIERPEELQPRLNEFYARLFNRRAALRVRPSFDRRWMVTLEWDGGEVQGRLSDISTTGMGLSLPLVEAYRLMTVDRVHLRFRLPGLKEELEGPAQIVSRKASSGFLSMGLAFDLEDPGGLAVRYQALEDYVARRAAEIARWESQAG